MRARYRVTALGLTRIPVPWYARVFSLRTNYRIVCRWRSTRRALIGS